MCIHLHHSIDVQSADPYTADNIAGGQQPAAAWQRWWLPRPLGGPDLERTRGWDVHSLMLSSDMLQPPGLVLALVSTGASFFMQWKFKMENGGWLNISVFFGPINVEWLNGCKIFTHAKALWPTFKLMRRVTCKRSVRSVVHGVRADAGDCVGVCRLPVKSGQLSVPTCCGCCC